MKAVFLILIACVCASGASLLEEVSRKDAKAQSFSFAPADEVPIEVFQVLELPLSVHEASLIKSEKGYLLKLALGNSSDLRMIGLRYFLVRINSQNQAQAIVNRTEGFAMSAYATKTLTFRTPIKLKPRDGGRLVLMLEQVVSRESIWEVIKAKEAFEAYAKGDYSVMPVVLRVANQVDAPPERPRVIYRRF